MITSTDTDMIDSLAAGLEKRYGEITRKDWPVVNYLGMVFDLTAPGVAIVSMTGYVDDMLKEVGTVKGARTPATEGLFDVRPDIAEVTEEQSHFSQTCSQDVVPCEASETGLSD